jgi:hypothetical protein
MGAGLISGRQWPMTRTGLKSLEEGFPDEVDSPGEGAEQEGGGRHGGPVELEHEEGHRRITIAEEREPEQEAGQLQ